jgi:hypothetical protein
MKFQVSAIALGCIALLSGCGGGGGSSSDGLIEQSILFPLPGAGNATIGIPPDSTTIKLTATASGNGPVTYTSNTPDTCTVSGDMLSLLKAGECSVTASQAGGDGFAPASQRQLFVIPKNPQMVVKFQNPGWQPMGGTPVQLSAIFSSSLPATYTSKTPAVCSISGNTMTPLGDGMCIITADQAGNDVYLPATVDRSIPIGTEKPQVLNFLTGYKDNSNTNEGLIGHPGNVWWCMQCSQQVSADGQSYTFNATWDTPTQPGDWNYDAAWTTLFGANLEDVDLWKDEKNRYRGGVNAFTVSTVKPKGVQIEIQGALHFNLAQNPEWFASSNNKVNVELFLGHFNANKLDADGHTCNVTLKATVQPTAAAATSYSVNLQNQFAISNTCDLSGLDLWTELQSYPVVEIKFSADKANGDVTNGAGKYATQFTLTGPVYFQ